jgi:hypothetical protein
VVLIKQRRSSLIAAGGRWVERQFGKKPLSIWKGRCDLRQLNEVGLTGFGVLMEPLQMWRIPSAYNVDLGWPACGAPADNPQSVGKGRPIFGAGFGRLEIKKRLDRLIGFGQAIQQTCGGGRTGTGEAPTAATGRDRADATKLKNHTPFDFNEN